MPSRNKCEHEILISEMSRYLSAILSTLLAFATLHAQSTDRKPSTPEDRAKVVEVSRSLEAEPLAKIAKDQRNWIVHWLIAVPDISVKVCGDLLGPLLGSNKNYSAEIFTQLVPSAAAFVITHPEKSKDDVAVYTAALEGALRTYESILRLKPKARWPYLDGLIEKRDTVGLTEHVRQVAEHCN